MTSGVPRCPLCHAPGAAPLGVAHGRTFFDCMACGLAFVHPDERPDAEAERARYETHRNDPEDDGYRAFLARLVDPLLAHLEPGARGIDFGSGPGPTLSRMMRAAGHPTVDYDPFFAPDAARLAATYDFIACSETVEHFFDPAAEFERLDAMLRPGGLLGVMTTMRDDSRPFTGWWYVRDPTHVCFYRPRTMEWIARRFGWTLERPHKDVTLFRKQAP